MEQAPGPVPAAPPPAPSFAEVLRLVRSGQEPPGVRRPRASPTGDTPTASRLPPPAKPWEGRPSEPARTRGPQHGSAHSCSQCSENEEPAPLSTQQPGGSSDIA
ncbi:peroxisomal biogenesis factor 39 [Guaruba guarouba]